MSRLVLQLKLGGTAQTILEGCELCTENVSSPWEMPERHSQKMCPCVLGNTEVALSSSVYQSIYTVLQNVMQTAFK